MKLIRGAAIAVGLVIIIGAPLLGFVVLPIAAAVQGHWEPLIALGVVGVLAPCTIMAARWLL